MASQKSAKAPVVPSALRGLFYELTELTDACSKEYLNDEYAALCRDLLKIRRNDTKWCLPSRLDEHPLAWLIQVNGFVLDARDASREIQEEA